MASTRRGARLALALLTLTWLQAPAAPAYAGIFGGPNPALDYCATERAPLVAMDKQFTDAERSRIYKSLTMGAAVLSGGLLASVLANRASGGKPTISGSELTYSLLAGVAASVGTYLTLKAQAGIQDRRALALSVDADAGQQLDSARYAQSQAAALSACRQRQVAEFQARATAAGAATPALTHEKGQITDAVKQDIGLTDRLVGRQAGLAKTFTQARAMAEGQSEAKVLGTQTPAYAVVAGAPPPTLPSNSVYATLPPPVAAAQERIVITTLRSTPVRAAPSTKAKVLATLPARHEVTPAAAGGDVSSAAGWTPVDVEGQTGYARAVNLSGPRTVTSSPGAGGLAPPTNVRQYNKVVLESRDEGPDRMRSLLTNFQ